MNFNHTLSAVLRGRWLLEQSWAEAHIPLVLSMLKGNPVSFVERSGSEFYERPFVVDPATLQKYDYQIYDWRAERYVDNPAIPENSVAIIPITGPITKYNGECGEAGAVERASWLWKISKRQNIGSVILLIDTPGGEARAANEYLTAIRNLKKPCLAFVNGMAASLGMWLIAACDEAYVSSNTDQVGSIGSYCTILDFRGYLEKEGIKLHEIYAPQSVDKNKDYREALKGNYELVEDDLKIHVNEFISFIKKARPASASFSKEWSTGKMFYPTESKKYGLIDGVSDLQKTILKASFLARNNKKAA